MHRVALHGILILLVAAAAGCHRPAGTPVAPAPEEAPVDNGAVVAPPIDNAPVATPAETPADNVPAAPPIAVEEAAAALPAVARPLRPVRRVVVDPGHGGENAGAIVAGAYERVINLDVGLKLAALLRAKGFQVTLTRADDTSVSLEDRAEIANRIGADLFISIHSNAAANTEASGIEVYFPTEIFRQNGRYIDDDARAVDIATRDLPDGPFTWDGDFSGGVTPARLALNRDLGRAFAGNVERAMVSTLGTGSRGVKPAGYEVLRWSACPAVLIEMGFLTNDDDRVKLESADYRSRIAQAIADAVCAYGNLAPTEKQE